VFAFAVLASGSAILGCGDDGGGSDASLGVNAGTGAGVGSDGRICDRVNGRFDALYTPVSGDCGPITSPHPVPFVPGSSGVNTLVEMQGNHQVITELVFKGCVIGLKQTVRTRSNTGPAQTISEIEGDSLEVISASEVKGEVTYLRFATEGSSACSGVYAATFTEQSAG
jgi:hypothetical protein